MSLKEFTDLPTRKLNRLSSRAPRTGKFWCGCCDAAKTNVGMKCPVCGYTYADRSIIKRGELK